MTPEEALSILKKKWDHKYTHFKDYGDSFLFFYQSQDNMGGPWYPKVNKATGKISNYNILDDTIEEVNIPVISIG